jgi:uncharacterized membrane-anchored protein YjiN (DUF445 family)
VQISNRLSQRLSKTEERIAQIPQLIKQAVTDEMRQYDNTKFVQNLVDQANSKVNDRIAEIEKHLVGESKKTQKALKKLKLQLELLKNQPQDEGRLEDLSLQISELKRRQTSMFDLVSSSRHGGERDLDRVNSQLTGLWTQLSSKRSDSPIRHPH